MKKTTMIIILCLCLGQALHTTAHHVSVSTSPQESFATRNIYMPPNKSRLQRHPSFLWRSLELEGLKNANVSATCVEHMAHLLEASPYFQNQLRRITIDLRTYLSRLSNVWPGSFRECFEVQDPEESQRTSRSRIQGQFCLAFFLPPSREEMTLEERFLLDGKRPPINRPVTIPQTGLCVPSSCSSADVHLTLEFLLNAKRNWTITVPNTYCQTEKTAPIQDTTKLFLAFVGLLLLLVVVGTLSEIHEIKSLSRDPSPKADRGEIHILNLNGNATTQDAFPDTKNGSAAQIVKFTRWFLNPFLSKLDSYGRTLYVLVTPSFPASEFLKCFSIYSNAKTLFKLEPDPSDIECFNGIRFYVMAAVLAIHVLQLSFPNGWRNLNDGTEGLRSFYYQGTLHLGVFLEASVAIGSGLLTMSTLRRIRARQQTFNLLTFYARRIWRLVPAYFITLAIAVCVLPYIGEGPRWPDLLYEVHNCRKNGWTNVLFLNNVITSDRMCQFHFWYNAADVQLLLIAPILILSFNRSLARGLATTLLAVSLSVGWLGYKAYFHGINGKDLHQELSPMNSVKYLCELYYLPFSRLGCYAVGVASGYLGHVRKRENIRLHPVIQNLSSVLAITLLFSPGWHWYSFETNRLPSPTRIEAALIEAFCRVIWTLAGAYLCVASYARFQDPIAKAFTWLMTFKFQTVTARLQYSVYLLHYSVILLFFATVLEPMDYSFPQLMFLVMALLATTYVIAIPYTLLVEMPFMNLAKLIENRFEAKQILRLLKDK